MPRMVRYCRLHLINNYGLIWEFYAQAALAEFIGRYRYFDYLYIKYSGAVTINIVFQRGFNLWQAILMSYDTK